ncbi:hypothetical protein [Telmatospirillum sp. J64-1]|uniref:hypothetical protein n=1 Tax=Telmatospirillum sp. J64-1 TaxID=2502183 RepID=UPI00115D2369|nr:hypothetical protein [Telmatospirillum sp. J64-1]
MITVLLILIVCILLFGAAAVKGVFVRVFGLLAAFSALMVIGIGGTMAWGGIKDLLREKESKICLASLNETWPGDRKITQESWRKRPVYSEMKISGYEISVFIFFIEDGAQQALSCKYNKEPSGRTTLVNASYSHSLGDEVKVQQMLDSIKRRLGQ